MYEKIISFVKGNELLSKRETLTIILAFFANLLSQNKLFLKVKL